MRKNFHGEDEVVVAAVAFDEDSSALVDSAVEICRRTGMHLRLVHVCQPEDGQSYLLPYFAHAERLRLEEFMTKSAVETATKMLDDLRLRIPSGIESSARVMVGDPAEWINADAVSCGASVIIIGMGSSQKRFIPQSWSTALTLMANSSLPVMVLQHKEPLRFPEGQRIRIMVADDLSEGSRRMMESAVNLAVALRNVDFHHLHASGLTEETIATALNSAVAASHSHSGAILSPPAMHAMIKAQIHATMEKRINESKELFQAMNGHYHCEILFGEVQDSISEMRQRINPSILVFGRHQRIHRRPFLIGRVPFQAMVAQGCPVMIVPQS